MRTRFISSPSVLVVLAASGLALAACSSGPTDPNRQALDAIYHIGQNDAFGAAQDDATLRAAAQPPAAPLTAEQKSTLDKDFNVGQNDAFGAAHSDDAIVAQQNYAAHVAATVPMVNGKRDLLGDGGAQDAMAKQMFPLGTSAEDFGGKNNFGGTP
ncbi:MAG: hypothetical protein ACLQJR_13980 [Stellaceae bacterium]